MKKRLRNIITKAGRITPGLRGVYAENAALKHALKTASAIHEQLLLDAGRMRQARAGMPADFDIIVPVCNAQNWLPFILDAYQRLKLDPLFIVDQRSQDASLDLLISCGARRMVAPSGEQPTVESLLFPILHILQSKYILRLDDDELPSQALLSWITAHFNEFSEPAIALPRRWVASPAGGHLMMTGGQSGLGVLEADFQYRLFQPKKIRPVTYLHSPGFELTGFATAPPEAVIYHLDWIVRSYQQRKAKVAVYDSIKPGLGQKTAKMSLPEDRNFSGYALRPLEDPVIIDVCNVIQKTTKPSGSNAIRTGQHPL
jgi:hypothetical protein